MIKKTTAWIFILLANLILAAHAVVPHHHHAQITCFWHCSCTHTEQHNSETGDCGHNCNSSECFLLKQLAPAPSNQFRHECKCLSVPDNHNHFSRVTAVLAGIFTPISTFLTASAIELPPFIITPYSVFVARSSGFRAPPVVS